MSESAVEIRPLRALGEALLRLADRARVNAGVEPFDETMHVFVEAMMDAFATADARGSVCVSLGEVARKWGYERDADEDEVNQAIREKLGELAQWQLLADAAASDTASVHNQPLTLDEGPGGLDSRLYFTRFFAEEVRLAKALWALASHQGSALSLEMEALVQKLTAAFGSDALQTKAVRLALENHFSVISGGPGTGKTTTVVLILECLLEENPNLMIYLAAPTGKATGRMRESIEKMTEGDIGHFFPRMQALVQASEKKDETRHVREHTIHKWLVTKTASGDKPSPENPLPADVLIIDEASMVDIHLAARLFEAVSSNTRVIILGDKHQLAAVGPGAVFAAISSTTGALAQHTVELKKSRRFAEGSVIARLASAINHEGGLSKAAAKKAVHALFADPTTREGDWQIDWDPTLPVGDKNCGVSDKAKAWLEDHFSRYADALIDYLHLVERTNKTEVELFEGRTALWEAFNAFRPLCAQRHGLQSVEGINTFADNYLRARLLTANLKHWLNDPKRYPGLALIIRQNDDMLGVFNGDIALVLPDGQGECRAYFDAKVNLPPMLLPRHDIAYAMTIHQSQGSEFKHVAVFLPTEAESGLATRELLYTGVTRTQKSVAIFGTEAVLDAATERRTERVSGLADRLAALV